MADVLPLKLMDLGAGLGQLREFQAGDSLSKALMGLGNVDNTSDANKPVSTAQATAIAAQATAIAEKVAKTDMVATFNTVSGTVNDIVLTVAPVGAATATLRTGTQVRFRASAANTGATTINWGGTGVKSCRTITGVALPAGYLRTDVDTTATYDGTYFVVQREVERGSNANGEYTRWADGTQECWLRRLIGSGSPGTAVVNNVPLPAAFSSAPNAQVTAISGAPQLYGIGCLTGPLNHIPMCLHNGHTAYVDVHVSLRAVGRWFE